MVLFKAQDGSRLYHFSPRMDAGLTAIEILAFAVESVAKHKLILAGICNSLCLAALAPATVVVSPVRLEESRSITIVDDKIGHSPDQLKITLSIKGPEAETDVRYGNLHIDQAIDDRGTILLPPKDDPDNGEKFQEYSNAFFR